MAGDWIKMRTGLWDHPKVVRIVSAICPQNVRNLSERCRVIGALYRTWALADAYTEDGVLDGYDSEALDIAIGIDGWSANLQHVGWLIVETQRLVVPRFTEHNGTSAKRRADDNARKNRVRKMSEKCPKTFGQNADQRREEKRREDIKPPKPPRGRRVVDRSYSGDFLAFWAAFPGFRKGGKPVAWDAWQKAILRKPACEIIAAASEYASSPLGRSEYAQGPAPWLNQDRWDDDRAMWRRALPGAAPVKRQKSPQEIEESLRYEIVTLGKRAGKSPEQINADLLARGLKP